MNIKRYLGTTILSAALLLASGIPGLAKDSRTLILKRDAVLTGKNIPAGKYVIKWQTHSPEATVEFAQGHKVILSTEGRVEHRGKKYNANMVVYDASNENWTINEIRFAGSSDVLVFNQ